MGAAIEYQLSPLTELLRHGGLSPTFFRDTAEDTPSELDAKVASGDYFVTLATELETLNDDRAVDYSVRTKLEDIVSDLLCLYEKYEIVEKKPSYRG